MSRMTRAELERLDFDVLAMEAFGVASGDVVDLPVEEITIRWKQDLLNAKDDMARLVLTHPAPEVGVRGAPAGTASSRRAWAEAVLRGATPVLVDVVKGGQFVLQDGHHRYLAAKFLKRPLRAEVQVKANPIDAILQARTGEAKKRTSNPASPAAGRPRLGRLGLLGQGDFAVHEAELRRIAAAAPTAFEGGPSLRSPRGGRWTIPTAVPLALLDGLGRSKAISDMGRGLGPEERLERVRRTRHWEPIELRIRPQGTSDERGGGILVLDGNHRLLIAREEHRPYVKVSFQTTGRASNPTTPPKDLKGSQIRTAMKKPGVSHVMKATVLQIVHLAETQARDRLGSPDAVLKAVLGKVLPYAAHTTWPPAKALTEEVRRALIAADTAVRVLSPMLLDGIGMSDAAERLRTLPELVDQATCVEAHNNLGVSVREVAGFGELHVAMNDARRVGFRAIQSANWGLVSAMRALHEFSALHESQRESQRRGAAWEQVLLSSNKAVWIESTRPYFQCARLEGLSARKHAAGAGFHAVDMAFLMLSMSLAPPLPQRTVPVEPVAVLEALQTMLFRMACLDDRCRLHEDCREHPELGAACYEAEVLPLLRGSP